VAISYLPTISVIARALRRRARGNLNPYKIVCISKKEIASLLLRRRLAMTKIGGHCFAASLLAMAERSLLAMSRFVLASPPKAGVAISSFTPRSEGVSNVIEIMQSIDSIHTWGKMKMGIKMFVENINALGIALLFKEKLILPIAFASSQKNLKGNQTSERLGSPSFMIVDEKRWCQASVWKGGRSFRPRFSLAGKTGNKIGGKIKK
jgi:hypothetical protein